MACTDSAASVHILSMATRKPTSPAALALLCIHCSGGAADKNGAYTVCALCELNAAELPAAA